MLIYIDKNYTVPELFKQTPFGIGKWKNLEFTFDDLERCDYLVVLNHPSKDIHLKCRKGGCILIIQEPPYTQNDYLKNYFPFFDIIITGFDKKYSKNIVHTQASLPWLIDKNYDNLLKLSFNEVEKIDRASWITSNKNVNPGHELRLKFIENIQQHKNCKIDLFGRGIKSLENKFDGIYPYKYSLAIENYSAKDYWTEKISDIYLSWSMPICYGCTNLNNYFPEKSFVNIDINNPEEAIEIINQTIKDKLWNKNINAIKEARELILNKYQLFPFISDLIEKQKIQNEYVTKFIPKYASEHISFATRIKKIFKK